MIDMIPLYRQEKMLTNNYQKAIITIVALG